MTWAVHISLAPTWFDPGEHTEHHPDDGALRRARRDDQAHARQCDGALPRRSWTAAGRPRYEFVLRKGVVFHNGDAFTAEDVSSPSSAIEVRPPGCSRKRWRRSRSSTPSGVRFRRRSRGRLHDLLCLAATGAGLVVPKKYIEKVGDDGFRKAPVGAGPTGSPRSTRGGPCPGGARSLLAQDPAVKAPLWKVGPRTSRGWPCSSAGEVDIAYSLRGPSRRGGERRRG